MALSVDRGALGVFYAQVLNQYGAKYANRVQERFAAEVSAADKESQAAMVSVSDPLWAEKEYGTLTNDPDPWAVPLLMQMESMNG